MVLAILLSDSLELAKTMVTLRDRWNLYHYDVPAGDFLATDRAEWIRFAEITGGGKEGRPSKADRSWGLLCGVRLVEMTTLGRNFRRETSGISRAIVTEYRLLSEFGNGLRQFLDRENMRLNNPAPHGEIV